MKKVLHFIHGLNIGGAETLVKDYAMLLDNKIYNTQILCLEHVDSPYEELLSNNGINVIYVCDEMPLYGKKSILSKVINCVMRYLLVRKHIKAIAPDILHTHLTINQYVKFAKPPKNTRIIHTVHSEPRKLWLNGNKARTRDFLAAKWLARHRQMKFIALHESARKEINELFDVADTVVLNNGINYSKFEDVTDRESVRQELGIPLNAFVMGHVGRFSYAKNHEFLVEVFSKVCTRMDDAFLLMIGAGEKKQVVEDLLDQLGLREKYLILSNRLDLPDLLNAMDVFVFPSIFEGLPLSVIEAQKMKLPCIVSDRITSAIQISNLVKVERLDNSSEVWAEQVCKFSPEKVEYFNAEAWDMKNVILKLQDIYQGEQC